MKILIKSLILLLMVFLPWAFGTVEKWAIALALGTILTALMLTLMTQPQKTMQQCKYLIFYWFTLLLLFLPYSLFQMEIDIFSIATQSAYTKPYDWLPASLNPALSFNMLLLWAGWGGIAWLVMFHFQDRASLKLIIYVLIVNALLLSVVAILQKVTQADKILWFRPITFFWDPALPKPFVGPFVNRNHYAAYINLIWPMIFPLYILLAKRYRQNEVKRKDALILVGIILLVLFSSLTFSASRGGLLVAGIMGLFSLFLFPHIFRKVPIYYWVGGLCAGILLFLFAGDQMFLRLMDSFSPSYKSIENDGRWYIWKDCGQIIHASPVFGWGPGCFQGIFAFFKDPEIIYRVEYAHNDYLQALIETGWMGLVFWLTILGILFTYLLVKQRRLQSRFRKVLCKATILILFGMSIHAIIDFPFQMGGLSLTFAGLAGLALAATKEQTRGIDENFSPE